MTIREQLNPKGKYTKFVSLLFNARTNAHIAHLQTTSYAAHKALDDFYSEVVGLADRFAESAQGTQGILKGYTLGTLCDCPILDFLKSQHDEILKMRSSFTEGHLLQIIDDTVELYSSTIYKLTFLK